MTPDDRAARIATLETEIAALETAEMARLTGTQISKQSYAGHSMEFTQMSAQDLSAALGQRRLELSRLQGRGGPFGMVR